tara:strand:+ start:8020 stop:8526 length:507 start_codon:yes stop_codon:yes gene_type:complete
MTTNEEIKKAVKIVTEYMGKTYYSYLEWNRVFGTSEEPIGANGNSFIIGSYYCSLDRLCTVWEKLDCVAIFDKMPPMYACELHFKNAMGKVIGLGCAKTIQEAALLATAKAIEALRNEHEWFYYKTDDFRSCKKCGYIENKKNKNQKCKGRPTLSLRNERSENTGELK